MNTSINATIEKLKAHGRYESTATYALTEIRAWEEKLALRFPASFARILTGGTYDIANFYFQEPKRSEAVPGFVVFARWNDDRFAFDERDIHATAADVTPHDPPVYVLLGTEPPYKKYADFADWFTQVAALADRPVNPE